jgi:hypothetical protein
LRTLPLVLALFSLVSCSKMRNFEQATTTKTHVDPLFVPKNINQKFNGDSVKLKVVVPLSQETIGHYDLNDILDPTDGERLSNEQKTFLQKKWSDWKYRIYNMGISLGLSNRVRYSTDYEFPSIDDQYIKEVKVKKIFFALDECEEHDLNCEVRAPDQPLTFNFIDKFFVNLSIIQPHDSLKFLDEPLQFLSKKEFNRYAASAFSENTIFKNQDLNKLDAEAFYNVNIANMEMGKKVRKQNKNVRDNGRTFIYKVEPNHLKQVRSFFMSKNFHGIVYDVTLVGRNLYVELYHPQLKDKFFEKINEEVGSIYSLGVKDFKGCTNLSCTYLSVNDMNLVPMLKKSSHIKFDTFLSLKNLDYNDFKYSGYVELSIELDLPL